MTHPIWIYFMLVSGIIVMPGMDMAFVLGSALRSLSAGWAAVMGVMAGGVVHLALAFLGISLVLASIPYALQTVLVAGSLYLGWIGWSLASGASAWQRPGEQPPRSLGRTFAGGMATALLNPKAYLFMLAVFPQFLRFEAGSLASQMAVLGTITSAIQAVVYGGVAVGAARARSWLERRHGAQVVLARSVGVLLMLLALSTLARSLHGLAVPVPSIETTRHP